MARMDGSTVRRGDVVYDILYGVGTVQHLYADGRGAVHFSARNLSKTYHFETGVMTGGVQRTLFWSEPFLVPPPKDRTKYAAYQTLATALAALVIK